jgi:hypothetical protein
LRSQEDERGKTYVYNSGFVIVLTSKVCVDFSAARFRRGKQNGLTVNGVNLMITHQKRAFAERS